MTKYDAAFRHRLVSEYLNGSESARSLARRHGVGNTTLVRWIAAYRHHGEQGLRQKYSRYSAEFKLQVLQHMWREALTHTQASAHFDLRDSGAVGRWERRYHEAGFNALQPRPASRRPAMPHSKPTRPDMSLPADRLTHEELLQENEYLRAEVAYLKKLDELLRNQSRAATTPPPRKTRAKPRKS